MKIRIKHLITCLIVFSYILNSNAQKSGTISYNTKMKLDIQMDGGAMEAFKDMLPPSMETVNLLAFNNNESTFKEQVNSNSEEQTIQSDDETIKLSMMTSTLESILYHNFNIMKSIDQKEFMGRQFLVLDDIKKINWKLSNEKVKYLDYECIKATAINEEGEEIVAWFTPQIPQKVGPNGYGQLPGAILMLSVGGDKLEYKASEIKFEEMEIKEPTKGKEVTKSEFKEIRDVKMKEMKEQMRGEVFIIGG